MSSAEDQERERAELEALRRRVAHLEAQSERAESEYTRLASLYVAAYQLHSTLEPREVMHIIVEILLNLVGARTFALLVRDDAGGALVPVAAHGVELPEVPALAIAEVARAPRFAETVAAGRRPVEEPLVAVPLKLAAGAGGETVGVLAVWDFLEQKQSLTEVDYEIFNLLGQSAANALEAAVCAHEVGARAQTPRLSAALLLEHL